MLPPAATTSDVHARSFASVAPSAYANVTSAVGAAATAAASTVAFVLCPPLPIVTGSATLGIALGQGALDDPLGDRDPGRAHAPDGDVLAEFADVLGRDGKRSVLMPGRGFAVRHEMGVAGQERRPDDGQARDVDRQRGRLRGPRDVLRAVRGRPQVREPAEP